VVAERVVVAVDGSDSAQRAVEWVARHAAALDATVIAVHAVEDPIYTVPPLGTVVPPLLTPEVRDEIRSTMEQDWCAPLREANVAYRTVLADGHPPALVMKVAADEDADLVVVGRRGRGGFAELLLGSVSHQLSHHLRRPLLIVP
jgi:nucleotide-binding universal stress UspA family protein